MGPCRSAHGQIQLTITIMYSFMWYLVLQFEHIVHYMKAQNQESNWGSADAEIKVLSVENPELTNLLTLT